uniref:Aldehyde dehydrogenase domain-containing protein n=1 Tax=Pseudomonas marincola TaxID=437900 RepID=A0A653DXP2_9PSED
MRYQRNELPALLDQINASGYGLTLGVHTRIDETISQVVSTAKVGNMYVNRNIVGAVVGVQPFGGEGLSGTGPKAGGPLYLYRLLSQRPQDAVVQQLRSDAPDATPAQLPATQSKAFAALCEWAAKGVLSWQSRPRNLQHWRKAVSANYCLARLASVTRIA